MSKILRRDQFLKKNTTNEAITNDIPWGDSLIGRLINSIARKAGIAIKAKRIDSVISGLRTEFDRLLEEGKADIDNSRIVKLQLWTFFSTLKKQVDDEEEVSTILNTAKKLRDEVDSISELEDKDNILEAIDSFIEFLEGLEDSEGDDEEEGEEGGEEEGEGGEEGDGKDKVKLYPLMIKNLKSLGSLLSQYKTNGGNSGRGVSVNTAAIEKIVYITKANDTVAKIVASPENKLKWDSAKIWAKNPKPLKDQQESFNKDPKIAPKGNKDNMSLKAGLKISLGSYKTEKGKLVEVNERLLSEATLGVGGGENRGVIKSGGAKGEVKSGESHLEQAFSKLKKDIDVLISSKEKGIGVDSVFIDSITKSALDSKNKETIYKLYREIKRYLDGDKKLTIQERDALYKESIEILSDDKKIVVVAEKIARFCKRAFQFEGENLYGGMGDLGRPLEEFNKTMKEVMGSISSNPVRKEEPKEKEPEPVKDAFIFKYGSFVNSLLEKNSNSEEIQTKFEEFFTAEIQDKISFTDEEIEELKKTKERPGGKLLIQNASDPVMSIIRLFNRAYRLHTPGAIPSGRTEGKVSVSVFNEYEYMGSGSGGSPTSPGAGPYRNIKIFDKWKAGVDSILADTKYRPIFSENTTLSFQSTETGKGDTVSKPGKMLLRFINKLNDDNTMYSGGGTEKGSMYKFYEEYFGLAPKEEKPGTQGAKDQAENEIVAGAITSVKTKWVKLSDSGLKGDDLFEIIKRDGEESKGLSFRFKVTNKDNKEVTYYACIHEFITDKKMGNMFFSQTGYAFDTAKVKLPETNVTPLNVNYGRIVGKFKVGADCNINYISLDNAGNTGNTASKIEYPVKSIEVLMSVDEDKPYKDFPKRLSGKFEPLNSKLPNAEIILKNSRL